MQGNIQLSSGNKPMSTFDMEGETTSSFIHRADVHYADVED